MLYEVITHLVSHYWDMEQLHHGRPLFGLHGTQVGVATRASALLFRITSYNVCYTKLLRDEHFRVKGRTTWYETVEQMQVDLKQYLHHYKYERPHQGRMMEGRTPYAMFTEGLSKRPVICESNAA